LRRDTGIACSLGGEDPARCSRCAVTIEGTVDHDVSTTEERQARRT